ncbi:MAG: hypothetical protein ISQ32_04975 [Rickettsiales bacterium]|nr:hypothetical protein [Rickettsiales bacterium]
MLPSLNEVGNYNLLNHLINEFKSYNISICIGLEFEFILEKNINQNIILDDIKNFALNRGINIDIQKEISDNQFEINFHPSFDIIKICDQFIKLKSIISEISQSYENIVNFSAKPNDKTHGNGLHVHISLYQDSKNLFKKIDNNESEYLLNSIAGLLKHLNNSLIFMISNESDLKRYTEIIEVAKKQKRYVCSSSYAPSHICWGKNNRTVAIRIPDSFNDPENRHIEYRVPSPCANIADVIFMILFQIKIGIDNNLKPIDPIFGNAFDKQYNLERIETNFAKVQINYEKSELKKLISKQIEKTKRN